MAPPPVRISTSLCAMPVCSGAGVTAMPLLMLKKGEAEEKEGDIVEGLLNAKDPPGWPPPGKETVFVRELDCRVLRPLLDFVDEV